MATLVNGLGLAAFGLYAGATSQFSKEGCVFDCERRRSVADTEKLYHAIFQLQGADDMQIKNLRRFHGLQANITGMEAGKAMIAAPGDGEHDGFEVEGAFHHHGAHNGFHGGNMSFIIPGLEKTTVQGDWVTVEPSRDDEKAKGFRELAEQLQEREKVGKEAGDMLDALMREGSAKADGKAAGEKFD